METDRERLLNPLILRRRLHVCFRVMIGARIDESGRFLNLEDLNLRRRNWALIGSLVVAMIQVFIFPLVARIQYLL